MNSSRGGRGRRNCSAASRVKGLARYLCPDDPSFTARSGPDAPFAAESAHQEETPATLLLEGHLPPLGGPAARDRVLHFEVQPLGPHGQSADHVRAAGVCDHVGDQLREDQGRVVARLSVDSPCIQHRTDARSCRAHGGGNGGQMDQSCRGHRSLDERGDRGGDGGEIHVGRLSCAVACTRRGDSDVLTRSTHKTSTDLILPALRRNSRRTPPWGASRRPHRSHVRELRLAPAIAWYGCGHCVTCDARDARRKLKCASCHLCFVSEVSWQTAGVKSGTRRQV